MEHWVAPLTGLLGVLVGGYLAHLSLGRLQREYLKTELNIRKKSEALSETLELTRAIAKTQNHIVSLLREDLTSEEFKIKNNEAQNEAMDKKRKLIQVSLFLSDEINLKIEKYHKYYNDIICMKIYDIYVDPNDKNVMYDKETEHMHFKDDFMHCLLGFNQVAEEIQKEIKTLYDKL